MKPNSSVTESEKSSQLGGTDQIEQLAADIAKKEGRSSVSDKDRGDAYQQLSKMSPPPDPKKSAIEPNN